MNYHPLSTAEGPELAPRAGDADAVIHVPASASFYEAAIEGLTLLDEQILAEAPDFPRLYESGVIYRKEARDTWRHADDVLCSGWGDCEDLAAWRVAELRQSGEDPDSYVYVYQSGPHRYHAVVARGSGRIEDPSLILGMQVSAERRKNMPKFVGQGEGNYPATGRPFGVCPRAAAAENRLETVGDASTPLVGLDTRPHQCGVDCPHFAERWKRALRSAINGDDGEDYADDGGQDYGPPDDGGQQPPDQPDQPPQGPRGPSRASRFASAVFSPFKTAGTIAYQPVRLANSLLSTGATVARGATNLATLPLRGLKKVFSIFGEEVPLTGSPSLSHNLLGVEEDDDYGEGDEEIVSRGDIFDFPDYEDVDDDDYHALAELSPESQRMRFETAMVAPGVWGGVVKIPRIDEPGKMFTMYTSPAPSEILAAERLRNLAVQAAHNPGLQLAVSPAALITMAAMRASEGGKIGKALKSIGRFIQIQG